MIFDALNSLILSSSSWDCNGYTRYLLSYRKITYVKCYELPFLLLILAQLLILYNRDLPTLTSVTSNDICNTKICNMNVKLKPPLCVFKLMYMWSTCNSG